MFVIAFFRLRLRRLRRYLSYVRRNPRSAALEALTTNPLRRYLRLRLRLAGHAVTINYGGFTHAEGDWLSRNCPHTVAVFDRCQELVFHRMDRAFIA